MGAKETANVRTQLEAIVIKHSDVMILQTRAVTGKMEVNGQMGVFVKYMGGPQTLTW